MSILVMADFLDSMTERLLEGSLDGDSPLARVERQWSLSIQLFYLRTEAIDFENG
jgi:hypothetical protein